MRVPQSVLISLTLLILLAAACVPAAPLEPATEAPTPPTTEEVVVQPLKVVLTSEPRSLDPSLDTIKTSLVIGMTMLDPLAMNMPDGGFVPWLAESWEAVSPTTWRLKLKEGVQFHNGEPFNAAAVAYSVDVYLNTTGEARGWYNFLTGTEVVDEYTIDLITNEPTSMVPATLAYLFVFPPEYHAELGSDEFGRQPVGTGPWRFVEWTTGVELKVERNPNYWGPAPAIDAIHFRWAGDASSRVALLETGDAHIAQNVPPILVERIENSGGARVEVAKSIRKAFLRMNIEEGPTADVRVRRSINHAINVEAIIDTLYRGRAYGRDTGFVLEGMEGYEPGRLQPFEYNPDLARELLAEAGYPDGFDTTLLHPVGRYMLDKESSEAIAGQLAQVGVNVELEGLEPGAFFSKVSSERVPGLHYAGSAPLFMTPLYHPLIEFQLGMPYAYGANERTDEYLRAAIVALDDAERIAILHEFEDYVFNEHVPWVWLWHFQDIYGVSNDVNWQARSDEFMSFESASFVR